MCVGEALNPDRPGYSAAQCAGCVAGYFAQIAACSCLKCGESGTGPPETGSAADSPDDAITTRSVACPHPDEPWLQKQACKVMETTRKEWWVRLNPVLGELVSQPET